MLRPFFTNLRHCGRFFHSKGPNGQRRKFLRWQCGARSESGSRSVFPSAAGAGARASPSAAATPRASSFQEDRPQRSRCPPRSGHSRGFLGVCRLAWPPPGITQRSAMRAALPVPLRARHCRGRSGPVGKLPTCPYTFPRSCSMCLLRIVAHLLTGVRSPFHGPRRRTTTNHTQILSDQAMGPLRSFLYLHISQTIPNRIDFRA